MMERRRGLRLGRAGLLVGLALLIPAILWFWKGPLVGEPVVDPSAAMRARFAYRDAPLPGDLNQGPVWAGNDRIVFADRDKRVMVWDFVGEPKPIGRFRRNLCSFADGRVRWTEDLWQVEGGLRARYAEWSPGGEVQIHEAPFGPEHLWHCLSTIREGLYRLPGGVTLSHGRWKMDTPYVFQKAGHAAVETPITMGMTPPGCVQHRAWDGTYFVYRCSNDQKLRCIQYWIVDPVTGVREDGCLPLPPVSEVTRASAKGWVFSTPVGLIVSLGPHDKLRPSLWFYDGSYHLLDSGVAWGMHLSPDGTAVTYSNVPSIRQLYDRTAPATIRAIFLDDNHP